jgi:hypothetical protein
MRAAPLGFADHAFPLQRQVHEVCTNAAFLLLVLAVEMLHGPPHVAVLRYQPRCGDF